MANSNRKKQRVREVERREEDQTRDLWKALACIQEQISEITKGKNEPTQKQKTKILGGKQEKEIQDATIEAEKDPNFIARGLKRVRKAFIDPVPLNFVTTPEDKQAANQAKDIVLDLQRMHPALKAIEDALIDEDPPIEEMRETVMHIANMVRLLELKFKYKIWKNVADFHGKSIPNQTKEAIIRELWEDYDVTDLSARVQEEQSTYRSNEATVLMAGFMKNQRNDRQIPNIQRNQPRPNIGTTLPKETPREANKNTQNRFRNTATNNNNNNSHQETPPSQEAAGVQN